MIFASDLDRTLIYSNRAIDELGKPDGLPLKPVEKKDGSWVSYMTEASFSALEDLCRHSLFIPVTTRTTEQFSRITLFAGNIPLKYSITSNGAEILHGGKAMAEWTQYISNQMEKSSVPQEKLHISLQSEGYQFAGQLKRVGNLFFYYILTNLPSASEISMLHGLTARYGWRISLQGRKLYFIPKAISKGTALAFICEREGKKAIAGAGDSFLDWDFLQNCPNRFVPRHGELISVSDKLSVHITHESGVTAGEEIIRKFLNLIPLKI